MNAFGLEKAAQFIIDPRIDNSELLNLNNTNAEKCCEYSSPSHETLRRALGEDTFAKLFSACNKFKTDEDKKLCKDVALRLTKDIHPDRLGDNTDARHIKQLMALFRAAKSNDGTKVRSMLRKSSIVFSKSQIRDYAKYQAGGAKYLRIDASNLAARVQHLIGELVGMAIANARAKNRKNLKVSDLKDVLDNDEALERVFTINDKQRPSEMIGTGDINDDKQKEMIKTTTPQKRIKHIARKDVAALMMSDTAPFRDK